MLSADPRLRAAWGSLLELVRPWLKIEGEMWKGVKVGCGIGARLFGHTLFASINKEIVIVYTIYLQFHSSMYRCYPAPLISPGSSIFQHANLKPGILDHLRKFWLRWELSN